MSTLLVRRPPRQPVPAVSEEPVEVEPPPEVKTAGRAKWTRGLMALPVLVGGVAMVLMFGQEGGARTYLIGGLFGISALAMLATGWGMAGAGSGPGQRLARDDYLRYLTRLRAQVQETVRRQRTSAHTQHPDPAHLWSAVDSHRLWERRRADPDFGQVRIGLATQPLATPLWAPEGQRTERDAAAATARQRFLDTHALVPDVPLTLPLAGLRRVRLAGDRAAATGLARAIVAQLAVFHAPPDLQVAVCVDAPHRADWEWVKWLPHACHRHDSDAVGPLRLVAGTMAHLAELVPDAGEPADPAPLLLIVRDQAGEAAPEPPPPALAAATVIEIATTTTAPAAPDGRTAVLHLSKTGLRLDTGDGATVAGTADSLPHALMEALARRLAPLRLASTAGGAAPDTGDPAPAGRVPNLDPAGFDPARAWAPRPATEQLRVTLGAGAGGAPVTLDLKESAAGGMGPHGLLVGATGSGKSELLRTIVLGLAAVHPSERLNLVLIDFKGGATFAPLRRLPQTSAVITNLADELGLVDRMNDALHGELVRRQELLRRAGNLPGRDEYERARADGAPLPVLPALLVVCDEFSELLAARPDLTDLFVQIGRLGRSLGVHLLLASQRLEEGRLRGLDAHLSYRIGLRTFSALESRAVLGAPDAYELPQAPGHGYLKSGTEELVRFEATYVSGPAAVAPDPAVVATPGPRVLPYGTRDVPDVPRQPTVTPRSGPSVLEMLVTRMAGAGPPAHRVWLPPLADPPPLDELLGPVAPDEVRGLVAADRHGRLRVPVAVIDKPFEQRRDPLWLELDGAGGHVAVVGGPRSGKSTAVCTLVCGLALTHTPAEVQVYCLDFGGGVLAGLRRLPHVGGVAGRQEAAAVRRTVAQIATLLAAREREGAGPPVAAGGHAHVFLVVDGWPTLRQEFEDLEPVVADLAARGLSYGVHVVATATRWLDLRPAVRDLLGSRVELRLGDPADSVAAPRAAAAVPEGAPGRGITADGRHLLTASPRLATGGDLVATIAAAWTGPAAPPVRLLPEEVPYDELAPEPVDVTDLAAGLRLPIGIAEADLTPVTADFAADPHLLVFGDTECGKSSFLRALATSLTRRFAPEQARLVLVDYRRSLLGAVTTEHLIGYGTSSGPATELLESVGSYLEQRLPGPDVTPAQLRDRSWWHGPECFVLVDDYDLVAAGGANPLQPLLAYLPQARDVGLHLVLARRSGGAARAMYEPVLQRLRELAAPGLVMSGDPDEGALVGAARPGRLPPGRGWLATRTAGVRLVQLAWLPPP